jgi:hypothetical protein
VITKNPGSMVDGLNAAGDYIDREVVFPLTPGGIPGFGTIPTGLPFVRDLSQLVSVGTQNSLPTVPTNSPGPAQVFPIGAPDRVQLSTSAVALGDVLGPYQGPYLGPLVAAQLQGGVQSFGPIASPLGSSNLNIRAIIRPNGIGWGLAGVAAGGATVSIGQYLNTQTTAVYGIVGTRTAGITFGRVAAYPINTTVFSAVAAGTGVVIPLTSNFPIAQGVVGITTSTPVTIGIGSPTQASGNQETVTPSAVTQGVLASQTITLAGTPGINTVTLVIGGGASAFPAVTITVNLTAANTATTGMNAIVAAINASAAVLLGSNFFLPFLQVVTNTAGVGTLVANALTPAAAYNLIPVTATITGAGGFTFVSGGTTLAGGINPSITATIAYAHAAGEPVQGINSVTTSPLLVAPSVGVLTAALVVDSALL